MALAKEKKKHLENVFRKKMVSLKNQMWGARRCRGLLAPSLDGRMLGSQERSEVLSSQLA